MNSRMNGVAHYLVGLLIMLAVIRIMSDKNEEFKLTPMMIIIVVFTAFLSHTLVDALARFTYHPSESNWSDPVYAGWHLLTYIAEAGFAIYFLRTDIRYVIAMLSSVGFDLWDWSIARPLEKYAGMNLPGIHWMADGVDNLLFGWTISLRNTNWALIIEVIFVIVCSVLWKRWHDHSALSTEPRPASWPQVIILLLTFGSLRLLTLV